MVMTKVSLKVKEPWGQVTSRDLGKNEELAKEFMVMLEVKWETVLSQEPESKGFQGGEITELCQILLKRCIVSALFLCLPLNRKLTEGQVFAMASFYVKNSAILPLLW